VCAPTSPRVHGAYLRAWVRSIGGRTAHRLERTVDPTDRCNGLQRRVVNPKVAGSIPVGFDFFSFLLIAYLVMQAWSGGLSWCQRGQSTLAHLLAGSKSGWHVCVGGLPADRLNGRLKEWAG
jgi:hypothetical protein